MGKLASGVQSTPENRYRSFADSLLKRQREKYSCPANKATRGACSVKFLQRRPFIKRSKTVLFACEDGMTRNRKPCRGGVCRSSPQQGYWEASCLDG